MVTLHLSVWEAAGLFFICIPTSVKRELQSLHILPSTQLPFSVASVTLSETCNELISLQVSLAPAMSVPCGLSFCLGHPHPSTQG